VKNTKKTEDKTENRLNRFLFYNVCPRRWMKQPYSLTHRETPVIHQLVLS